MFKKLLRAFGFGKDEPAVLELKEEQVKEEPKTEAPMKKASKKKTSKKKVSKKKSSSRGRHPVSAASELSFDKMTKKQLDEYAESKGIKLDRRKKKADMIADLKAGLK